MFGRAFLSLRCRSALKARTAVIARTWVGDLVHESIALGGRRGVGLIGDRLETREAPDPARCTHQVFDPGRSPLDIRRPQAYQSSWSALLPSAELSSGPRGQSTQLTPNGPRAKLIPAIGHRPWRESSKRNPTMHPKYRSCPLGLTQGPHMALRRRLVS